MSLLADFDSNKAFDGKILYTSRPLEKDFVQLKALTKKDQSLVKINIRKTGEFDSSAKEFIHLLNVVFKRCLNLCNYIELGRNRGYFDVENPFKFERHGFYVLNGYKAAIESYNRSLLLNLDLVSKLENSYNALSYILKERERIFDDKQFRKEIEDTVKNKRTITMYN